MSLSATVEKTKGLVRQLFDGVLDKAGRPYHEHCESVHRRLLESWPAASEDEQCAALLHDVIEDIADGAAILTAQFPPRVVELVAWVSVVPAANLPYMDWIRHIAKNAPLAALRIKLADNADNSDPARPFPGDQEKYLRRYSEARAILLAAYERRSAEESGLRFSDDAKALLGAWFAFGSKSVVTLHLVESRPAPRTRAALDELVAAGALSVEPFNQYGGEVYKPLIDTRPYYRWLGERVLAGEDESIKFRIMEPIT